MISHDFDPATYRIEDDLEIQDEVSDPTVELSSVEINILIYLVGLIVTGPVGKDCKLI